VKKEVEKWEEEEREEDIEVGKVRYALRRRERGVFLLIFGEIN